MFKLNHTEFIGLLVAMGTMLILARLGSEFARKLRIPVVAGEIIVGVILGPSILGEFSSSIFDFLFPLKSNVGIALDGVTQLSAVLLLFISGMEVQMQMVLRQGKAAVYTSFLGMIVPFFIGWYFAFYFPNLFEIEFTGDEKLLFSLFMGTAMSISALPVIAKILMDTNLFRTKLGMVIIASAMLNDLVGWLIFSLIISLMGTGKSWSVILLDISIIIGYGVFMLTIGKKLIDKSLPWIQKKFSWPGGVLSLSLGVCFFSAALTERLGIHAVLGAFIAGIAIGDSVKLNEKAREIIHQFISNIFAPLFFVSIGLKINFIENFNLYITLIVLVIAYSGKLIGASLGAKLGGFSNKESLAVGFGLNARGAMEIILGTLALEAGLINEVIFVALVIMALITSITSGSALKWLANPREKIV